jgi:4-amino-4-deoxy-L-arabinose transferase-like glycosyltransferase
MREQLSLQEFIHQMERGKFAVYLKTAMFVVLIGGLSMLYLFVQFAGLDSIAAMDQAQISKNLASGQGFSTNYIRPIAIWQLRDARKAEEIVNVSKFPDFFQSPLGPAINAVPLWFAKSLWASDPSSLVYKPDMILAAMAMLFFLLAVAGWYFVAARLFDKGLASLMAVLVLVTDMMWKFSLSALPQMLMLFLFSLASLLSVFAVEMALDPKNKSIWKYVYLAGAAFIFGLITLAHGLGIWLFLGWFFWVCIYFRPRIASAAIAFACFAVVVSPWLVRNYMVSGDPLGLGLRPAQFDGAMESDIFRSVNPDFSKAVPPTSKLKTGIPKQIGNLVSFMGTNFVALAFFIALMHPFKHAPAAAFKWGLVLMWILSVVGMAMFGVDEPISVNQMHVLFVPIFICYGLAMILVLWNRLHVDEIFLRRLLLGTIIFLVAIPQLLTIFGGPQKRIQWPPYVPPFIGIFNTWFDDGEVICSDMPWAVAWYSGRKSLLLPATMKEFTDLHDYKQLTLPINGLYLTPITGDQALFSGIYFGGYKEWANLITRPPQVTGFPLPVFTPLPIDGQCIIYADRDRWNVRR